MKNFIAELYMGHYHHESISENERTAERHEKLDLCDSLYKQLTEKLSKEDKKLLDELQNASDCLWLYELERDFSRGFKIGFLLHEELGKIEL